MSDPLIEKMLATLTPELVDAFRLAVEIGKWPDGRLVSQEQRETCMNAIIAWEHKHLPENQRTGYIDMSETSDCHSCENEPGPDDELPVKFVENEK